MQRLEKQVSEHDDMLRGNGDKDGLLSSVRHLVEAAKSREKLLKTILVGVVGMLVAQIITFISKALAG